MTTKRASGCLFGMAFGDALGFKTEFLSVAEIIRQFPPNGPQEIAGTPALVTDDTQMALAVGEALLSAPKPFAPDTLEGPLREAFIEWAGSPDNNRAPGMTCLAACGRLHMGMLWTEATVANSKGCGANMRVQAVGVLPNVTVETRAAVAQFQAALTHGHPTALAASDLTAAAIAFLIAGTTPSDLPKILREYALSQREVYHGDWLGPLWQRPVINTPEQFIARGWDECLGSLAALDVALENGDRLSDPCAITGAGWVAEEALATGLLCFLLFPDDPLAVICRAVVSSGDSDSIACLAGAFAGAYHGLDAWPADWIERIEYRDRLTRLGEAWD